MEFQKRNLLLQISHTTSAKMHMAQSYVVQCRRKAYGFEIKKDFFKDANEKVLRFIQPNLF